MLQPLTPGRRTPSAPPLPSYRPYRTLPVSITAFVPLLSSLPRNAQLLQRYRKRETYLEVNLGHVNEFRPDLLDMLTLRPVEFLPLFEQVRRESPSACMQASSGILPYELFSRIHAPFSCYKNGSILIPSRLCPKYGCRQYLKG